MRDYLPLLALLAGFALGTFYGTAFTLWHTKQQKRRRYANYGAHMVGTPPPAEDETRIDMLEGRITG